MVPCSLQHELVVAYSSLLFALRLCELQQGDQQLLVQAMCMLLSEQTQQTHAAACIHYTGGGGTHNPLKQSAKSSTASIQFGSGHTLFGANNVLGNHSQMNQQSLRPSRWYTFAAAEDMYT